MAMRAKISSLIQFLGIALAMCGFFLHLATQDGTAAYATALVRESTRWARVRSSLKHLDDKLSQSAWRLSTSQMRKDAARGSAAAAVPAVRKSRYTCLVLYCTKALRLPLFI